MSGRGFNNDWQQPEHNYWIYLPDAIPGTISLHARARRTLHHDGWMGGSDYGFTRVPSSGPSMRLFLIDTLPHPHARTPATFALPGASYEWPSREAESRLSQDEQKRAVNKLRKQLYSPHMSNIIRRLGTKSNSSSSMSTQDDNGKRCAVCLDDFETKQFVTVTPCNHMFHEDCIVPWVKSQGKCPVCRFVIAG